MQDSLIMWFLSTLMVMILIAIMVRALLFYCKKNYPAWAPKVDGLILTRADYNKRVIVLYLIGNIIFTSLTITLLVGFAQQRYRFYIDGLCLILFGLFIQTILLPLATKLISLAQINKHKLPI